jgi:FixJ family two-component response regulator
MKFTELHDEVKLTVLSDLKGNSAVDYLFSVIEDQAMNRAVSAAMTDNEMRAAACAEIRAIRSFKTNLLETINDTERSIKKSRA